MATKNAESPSRQESRPLRAGGGGRIDATRQRWQVLYAQLRAGREPCYRTEQRLVCTDAGCGWRSSCVVLRAEWRL